MYCKKKHNKYMFLRAKLLTKTVIIIIMNIIIYNWGKKIMDLCFKYSLLHKGCISTLVFIKDLFYFISRYIFVLSFKFIRMFFLYSV